jgi:hypothetical protein
MLYTREVRLLRLSKATRQCLQLCGQCSDIAANQSNQTNKCQKIKPSRASTTHQQVFTKPFSCNTHRCLYILSRLGVSSRQLSVLVALCHLPQPLFGTAELVRDLLRHVVNLLLVLGLGAIEAP